MNSLPKLETVDFESENFRGVNSERSELSSEDRLKFSSPEESLLSIVNSPKKVESTFLVIFKGGKATEDFKNNNPFQDEDSALSGRLVVLNKPIPSGQNIISFAEIILDEIEKLGMKRITLIGIEDGASVVQALSILDPRLFRRAILIDPRSRVSPGIGTKVVDWIEKFLPVGLPFRAMNKDFDSRPFLHRIRCPILVALSPQENFYNMRESSYIASKIPNCYLVKTKSNPIEADGDRFSSEFLDLLKEFQDSPAKRPQKNLTSSSQGQS